MTSFLPMVSPILGAVNLFFASKVEIQAQVDGHHGKIQNIHTQYIPYHIAAEDLAEDAAQVAAIDENQKGKAFSLSGSVF